MFSLYYRSNNDLIPSPDVDAPPDEGLLCPLDRDAIIIDLWRERERDISSGLSLPTRRDFPNDSQPTTAIIVAAPGPEEGGGERGIIIITTRVSPRTR